MKNILNSGASEFVQDLIDTTDIQNVYKLEDTLSEGCILASYEDLCRIFTAKPITRTRKYVELRRLKSSCIFFGNVGNTFLTIQDDIEEGDFKNRNVWNIRAEGGNIGLVLDRLSKITDRWISHHFTGE